jgi:tetratricopeptide (TPR) repeat protein
MKGYTTAYLFSFQDIVLLRAARELLDAEVPARRVRQALKGLRDQLPTGRPLSAVNISAVGDRVLVRDAGAVWDPDSGQLQMDFSVSEVASLAEPVARRALRERSESAELAAEDWYNTGVDLEAVAPDRAKEAYTRALELDPTFADAHLNLGRLLHEEGAVAEAEAHYRAATSVDPDSGRAFYNLGVALEDQGDPAGAMEAYEAAVRLDTDLAVAHFNLSRLFEADGKDAEALNHLAAYKRLLDRGSGGT